ncbi:beta-N-acetylhexosaminidase [Streptomyces sp. NPDC020965]|uniref:beta-N-acetylhexosaminidase n=1 Tax=Streptomyces sp. NPDC020965 TaxID=3365105 RepID=UPI003796EBDF
MNQRVKPPGGRLGRRLKMTGVATLLAVTGTLSTAVASDSASVASLASAGAPPLTQVVPAPVSVRPSPGVVFNLTARDAIHATAGSADARAAADFLAGVLRKPTGYALPVKGLEPAAQPRGVVLELGGANAVTHPEGYQLDITQRSVTIRADRRAGLFHGIGTLRQLLPVKLDSRTEARGPWPVRGGQILDQPRYAYRGAMLDVARTFLPDTAVKRYIDTLARYKINYFHLHLTDDQGWRVEIKSRPELTRIGGSSGLAGVTKGFYTQAQYKAIVQYAWARGITVIPEIEGPDHQHAALASYPELNCDGKAPPVYTGFIKSPDGRLCVEKPVTYTFMDQVIGEIAAMTPGPYIHIGGDETQGRTPEQIAAYYAKVAPIVQKYGKKVFGWQESMPALKPADTLTEFWVVGVNNEEVVSAAKAGAKVVMAPATNAYLDMKYTPEKPDYPTGNTWAGTTTLRDSYEWQPDRVLKGLPASAIAGVEAPLFTDTVFGYDTVENLAFPRLLAIADIGWAPAAHHSWNAFKKRVAAQGPRLRQAQVIYYQAPEVSWPFGS